MVVSVWVLAAGSRPVSSDRTAIRVPIARGSSAKEIARVLAGKRLIRSQMVFVFTCRMSGLSGRLKPGIYEFNRAMSAPTIIRELASGESLETWVVVPEGKTAREIADALEEKQVIRADSFVRLTIGGGQEFGQYPFVQGDDIEGYLFPDTYLFARGTQPHAVVEKMLDTFDRKVVRPNVKKIDSAARKHFGAVSFNEGLTRILTVASLIEREAKTEKDRPLVAAVIYNRLAKGMRLQVDATASYVPGESRGNKTDLTRADLATDTPYNTYTRVGLPPGPICNPGMASIRAAMEPASVDYLYYVAKPDGSHVFSRTLEEHNKAKRAIKDGATGG
jgi:UPF0755 protein